ncbi:fungal-specific transcription factor domain-containing protein [Kalaharituber pfeilii]|nr:fungal-specific transcription factor domain-containing protein [Kalaharituber pfeilii]
MVCEFKSATSSRSKGNSTAPESEGNHDSKMENSPLDREPSHELKMREDEIMSGVGDTKEERHSEEHGIEYSHVSVHEKPPAFPTSENIITVTRTTEKHSAPMFVSDELTNCAPGISERSLHVVDNTREAHVRELAKQMQGGMPRARHSSVGTIGTSNYHTPAPPSPVSTDIYQYGTPSRRFYSSTRSRSATTPVTGTPTLPSLPGPIGEDPRNPLLPGPKDLEHLVDLYFTHVYSQHYPFLHRNTFMNNLERHRPVLLFSLCAIAARFSDQFREAEEQFAVQARQFILESFDEQKLEVVQALVLMGLHDFGSNNGHKAWMFAGMAVRLGAAMNLNMEPRKEKAKTPVEAEVMRRTYWSYYLMDRLNSYGVARPFLTQDHDCHIQLPCDQSSFENQRPVITEHLKGKNPYWPTVGNEHMGAFAYLVRITSIWGDVLKYIHLSGFVTHHEKPPEFTPDRQFMQFVDMLKDWKSSLPPGLRYSEENLSGQIKAGTVGAFVMMHVMFHTCAAYVYRYVTTVSLPEKSKEFISKKVPKEYIVSSIRKIFVHADSIMQIMEQVWHKKQEAERNGGPTVTVVAPFIGQAVSDACTIGLIRASQAQTGVEAAEAQRKRVFIGLNWLKELKKYWKPMEAMYDKLRKACKRLEKLQNVTKSALPDSSSGTGSASVSPRHALPMENSFIPSPDSASQQIQMMQQNMVPYPTGSPLDSGSFSFDNAALTGDMLQTLQYTHLSDLIYNVPYMYYVDAFGGQGAMTSLDEYATDEGLFPPIFTDMLSPAPGLSTQPVTMSIGAPMDHQEQQTQAQHQLTTFSNGSIISHSPSISHASSSTHHYQSHHSVENMVLTSPAASAAVPSALSSPSSSSISSDSDNENEEGDTGPEAEEDFGHRYFEPRSTNRMEILHCLNIDDVREDVQKVSGVSENIYGSDDGDTEGDSGGELGSGDKYSQNHPPGGADAADNGINIESQQHK